MANVIQNKKSSRIKLLLWFSISGNIIGIFFVWVFLQNRGGVSSLLLRWRKHDTQLQTLSYRHDDKKRYYQMLPKTPRGVVFLGDSITEFGAWSEYWPNLPIRNRAISGDRTDGVLDLLPEVIAEDPAKIFLMIGINDFWHGRSLSETKVNYQKLIGDIHRIAPKSKVYIQSTLPINPFLFKAAPIRNEEVKELNKMIHKISKQYGYTYVDISQRLIDSEGNLQPQYTYDGIHLNASAYEIWRNQINSYVTSN